MTSVASAGQARSQGIGAIPASLPTLQPRMAVPFDTGEKLTFDVRFGAIKVGTGRMEWVGMEDVRGREAWHTRFTVKGGIPFYKVNDRIESWIDTRTFESLQFLQDLREGRRDKERFYEIYPDLGTYSEKGEVEHAPSVADPLDDAAFMYFVRTIPLEVGQTYEFDRYFRPDRNPVTIRVLRRERIRVPAGEFDAIVLQPIIKTKGIFSEGGRAEIWLSDDANRIMLQMKSKLPFGSLNLYLTSYQRGPAPAVVSQRAAPPDPP